MTPLKRQMRVDLACRLTNQYNVSVWDQSIDGQLAAVQMWVGGDQKSSTSTRPCSTRSGIGRLCRPDRQRHGGQARPQYVGYTIVCALAETFHVGREGGHGSVYALAGGAVGRDHIPSAGWKLLFLRSIYMSGWNPAKSDQIFG